MGEKERGPGEEESRQTQGATFGERLAAQGVGGEAGGAGDGAAMVGGGGGGGKSGGKGDPTTQGSNLNLSKSNVNRSAEGDDGDDAVEAAINNTKSNIRNISAPGGGGDDATRIAVNDPGMPPEKPTTN